MLIHRRSFPLLVGCFQEGAEEDEEDDEDFDAAAAAEEDDDEEGVEEVRGERHKQSRLLFLGVMRRAFIIPLTSVRRFSSWIFFEFYFLFSVGRGGGPYAVWSDAAEAQDRRR